MARLSDIFVSAVFVVDINALNVPKRVKELAQILRSNYSNYEVLIIDNGLDVAESKKIQKLLTEVPCIRFISLSKSHDVDTAIFAGIEASIGDYICTVYNNDPVNILPSFIKETKKYDIVFGVATNLRRRTKLEEFGAKLFYWYSKRFLKINVPNGSTYFISMNRSAANALTRSGRFMRHIRYMSKQVGFGVSDFKYELPLNATLYSKADFKTLIIRAIDLISNYSSHPLRMLSYFGIFAGLINIIYAAYVVIVNIAQTEIEKGWTTLSLQSSLMFFILFMILAVLAEYIGKILNEVQHEPPYHIMRELSSTTSIADETRRNVTK